MSHFLQVSEMPLTDVYIGLGGNIADSYSILKESLIRLQTLEGIDELRVSNFYITTPVSSIPQENYLNAVCYFKTTLAAPELLKKLQQIETALGKIPKPKDAPRPIDIDILLFGLEVHQTKELEIPHPHWMKRLFVLVPLSDLIEDLVIPDPLCSDGKRIINIPHLVDSLSKHSSETIIPCQENLAI